MSQKVIPMVQSIYQTVKARQLQYVAHVVFDMPVVVQRQVLMVQLTSGLSPYSALSLVRQGIDALRQSTELFEVAHIFSTPWFDSGCLASVYEALLASALQKLRILRSCSSSKVFDILVSCKRYSLWS